MIVDVHAHFYPDGYMDALTRSPEPYTLTQDALGRTILTLHGERIVTMTAQMTSPERRIEEMAKLGVDLQVVSITIPSVYIGPATRRRDLARRANDGLAEFVGRHPRHFAGLASLPLPDPGAAITELERAVTELGLAGALIGSNVDGRYLDDPAFFPLYERAQALDVPLLVHPMPPASPDATFAPGLVPLLGFVFNTSASVARMVFAGVFERLPRLTVVVGHLGGTLPYLMQRLDNGYHAYPEIRDRIPQPPSYYLRRLYYDTVSFSVPSLQCALGTVGAEQLVMGTDYPHVIGDVAGALDTIKALGLSAASVEGIMGGTAARLFLRTDRR